MTSAFLALLLLTGLDEIEVQLQAEQPAERFAAAEAAAALGARGAPLLPELINLLGDPEGYVRLAAGRALVKIGIRERDVEPLIERLELVPPEVSLLVAEALARQPASIPPLMEALQAKGSKRRHREVARALELAGPRAANALPLMLDRIGSKDVALQTIARGAVRRLAPWAGGSVPELAARLKAENPEVRWVAARLLANAGPAAKPAIEALRKASASDDPRVADAARQALSAVDVVAKKGAVDKLLRPKDANAKAPGTFKVKFETTRGDIVVEVTRELAPSGVDRFYNLVKLGFFDEARFFRVMPGFIVQFGLNGNPKVNSAWREATIQDDAVKTSNARGTLCFATAGPNTRTTQMFFNLGNNPGLDKQGFAPFGKIVEGLDVLDKIHAGYREKPSQQLIQYEGNAYLKREFPKLDSIKRAVVVTE